MQPGRSKPRANKSPRSSSEGPAKIVARTGGAAWRPAWEALLEDCPLPALVLDGQGRVLGGNASARTWLGACVKAEAGHEWTEIFEGLPGGLSPAKAVRKTLPVRLTHATAAGGALCELTVTATPLVGEALFTAYVKDCPRRDDELRESELRFRALFEQAPVSMQRFSPTGVSLRVNAAYEKLFQLTDEHLAAAKFNLLEDRQIAETGLLPLFKRAFAGESLRTPPEPFWPAQAVPGGRDEVRYIRGHFFPIRDSAGTIREIIAMHEDVTCTRSWGGVPVRSRPER